MASVDEHVQQAERNEAVAEYLADGGFYDWAITALFYAALNLMQAYFLEKRVHVASHYERRIRILNDSDLRPVSTVYNSLKIRSECGRYECQLFDREEYDATKDGPYATVIQHIRDLGSAQP